MSTKERAVRLSAILSSFFLLVPVLAGGWTSFTARAQETSDAATQTAGPAAAGSSAAAAAGLTRLPDMTVANGRLQIEAPGGPLRLGEENPFTITLNGPPLKAILVSQTREDPGGPCGDDAGLGMAAVLVASAGYAPPPQLTKLGPTIQQRANGSRYINVVPQCLGKIGVHVMAIFSDGAWASQHVQCEVIASKPPERIQVAGRGPMRQNLTMDLSERRRRQVLWIQGTWAGVKEAQAIPARDAKFRVVQASGEPAIHFDPATGQIDALRIGHALIETDYRGLTQSTCVVVGEPPEFSGYSRTSCEELREGGDRVLPTESGADAPGAAPGSRLPYTSTDGRRGRFLAEDRVNVTPPGPPLQMARNNPIAMTVRGPAAVARIECHTRQQELCEPWTEAAYGNRPGLPFTQAANGAASVQVFPTAMGPEEFTFFILFADGGVVLKKVSANVEPGSVHAQGINERCYAGQGANPPMPVRLNIGSDSMKYEASNPLYVFACYDGIRNRVMVPANLVHYSVKSEGSDAVVELDPAKGTVTGIRPGQALVQEEFAGLKDARCIVVVPWERRGEPDLSNCRALRAAYGPALASVDATVDKADVIQNAPVSTTTVASVGSFGRAPNMGVSQGGQLGSLGQVATPSAVRRIDAITAGTLSSTARDRFVADDRLEIPLNGVTVILGKPSPLPIRLHGPEPLAVRGDTSGANSIYRNPDGSLFVSVTAMQAKTAEFRIAVLFVDGGVATRRVEVPVKLPEEPAHLINALEGRMTDLTTPVTTLHLLVKAPGNTRTLFPFVAFGNQRRMIRLQPSDVTFSLRGDGADPVVSLDAATGTLTALRVGHAEVITHFDGGQSETCVVVTDDAVKGDASNCEELRGTAHAVDH